MNTRNLISITDLSKQEILDLITTAQAFERNPNQRLLEGKVVASLFFEPSTRTRLSFETAVNRYIVENAVGTHWYTMGRNNLFSFHYTHSSDVETTPAQDVDWSQRFYVLEAVGKKNIYICHDFLLVYQ